MDFFYSSCSSWLLPITISTFLGVYPVLVFDHSPGYAPQSTPRPFRYLSLRSRPADCLKQKSRINKEKQGFLAGPKAKLSSHIVALIIVESATLQTE